MEYALIKSGTVQNVIVADDAFIDSIASEWEHIERIDTPAERALGVGMGWRWDGAAFIAPPPGQAPTPSPADVARRITKLAFRNRFTKAEKAGIEFAALDDPTAPIAQRQQAAALRADLKDQEQATFIDLDDEDTRTGVLTLEAAGLIAAGRAVEILDAPVQDKEHHTG